ncbi:MAG: hypothetical protein HYV34_02295 [Candidatus Kerfeldbacteria bacterium]|nr:hypothetical protein [Candidatus Kerfeldbacteria bacterium]
MRRVDLSSLTRELREFFAKLRREETPVVLVEEGGKVLAAVVGPWELESYEENREKLGALLRELREANRGISGKDIEADIEAALQEVRSGSAI